MDDSTSLGPLPADLNMSDFSLPSGNVTFNFTPTFDKPMNDCVIIEGSAAVFEVVISGCLETAVVFFVNGTQIVDGHDNVSIAHANGHHHLTIQNCQISKHKGFVLARAENEFGQAESKGLLNVLPKSGEIMDLQHSFNNTENQITLSNSTIVKMSTQFICSQCPMILNESERRQHISAKHLTYFPFECATCEKENLKFLATTKADMDQHILTSHRGNNTSIVCCDQAQEVKLNKMIGQCRHFYNQQDPLNDSMSELRRVLNLFDGVGTLTGNGSGAQNDPVLPEEEQESDNDDGVIMIEDVNATTTMSNNSSDGNLSVHLIQELSDTNFNNNVDESSDEVQRNVAEISNIEAASGSGTSSNNVSSRDNRNEMESETGTGIDVGDGQESNTGDAEAHNSHFSDTSMAGDINQTIQSSIAKSGTNVSEKRYKCVHCTYASNNNCHLLRHIRAHTGEKPYKCSQCTFASARADHLKSHMHTHIGEKPYKCSLCSYASACAAYLKIHMRSHNNEKPYKCKQCSFASAQSGSLKIHVRTHTGEKPYMCKQCSYAGAASNELKRHMRIHTGEKPYKCTKCSFTCAQFINLKAHMRTHSGVKPYKCSQCTYATFQASHLKTHIRTHTGEKPYKCSQCSFAAARANNLKLHMRTHM